MEAQCSPLHIADVINTAKGYKAPFRFKCILQKPHKPQLYHAANEKVN